MIRFLLSTLLFCSVARAQIQSPIIVTNLAQLANRQVNGAFAAILISTNGNVEFAYDRNATDVTNTSSSSPIIGSVSGGRWFGKKVGAGGGSGDMLAANNLSELTATATARANLGAETRRTFNVLDYGATGNGVTDDTLAIRAAITAAGTNSTVSFPSGKTFLHRGALEPLTDQTWNLYGAKLKRANESTVNFSTAITTSGAQTITVASTNGFFVGMDVTVFNGSSFDTSVHRITSMTATTITMGTVFTTAFPSGGTLVSAFPQISAVNVPRVRIFGGELDGNQSNNTSLQKWQLNVEIYLASDGGVIRDTYIHDAQSEGIELAGVNVLVDHVRVENCQGNGIHLFATEHPVIRACKIKNVNLSGTATGHSDGCVIASNVVGDWIVEGCWLENGISGIGSFDSTDDSRLLIHGCTFTNFTTSIEGTMPTSANVSDVIATDNKFFNAGVITFNEVSGDGTDTNGVKNITFSDNQLTDTKAVFVLARSVTFSGNTITNSTTNAVCVLLTDCRDVNAGNNNITGGGFGFYVNGSSGGSNSVNISIHHNILRNQWVTPIDLFSTGMINNSAIGNTIIARTNFISPTGWVGMFVNDGSLASQNQIYAEDGLYGIQLGAGASGGSAYALGNKVITRSGMTTIKMAGGSVNAYVDQNFVSSAVVDSGANFIGNNVVIGNSISGGSGVTGTGKTVLSLGPSITNLLAWNRIGFIDSGATAETNHYISASAGSLFINTIGSLKVNSGNGIFQIQNTPINDGNATFRFFDTANSKTADINSLNGFINVRPASGAGWKIQNNTGGTTWLTVNEADGVITFPDGVRQTFNPNATTPGLNVGSQAGDPSTPSNGDLWYDSTGNLLRARINGATVSLGTGSGLGDFSGPSSSTNNNLVSFSGTTGKTGKDSGIATDGSGGITTAGTISAAAFIGNGATANSRIDVPNDAGTKYFGFQANDTSTESVNLVGPAAPFAGLVKTSINATTNMPIALAVEGTDYVSPVSTNAFTNKTFDSQGTGNVLKFLDYKDFVYPHRVDGTGATIVTNDYTSALSGLATYAGTGGTNANYAFFRIGTIPLDLDTGTTMKLRNLAVRVSGTDTGSASFSVGYFSPASSSAYSPSDFTALSGFVTATTGTLTSPAANDIFYLSDITLTGWASGVTAGRPFLIGIARDGSDANNDSITIVGGTIEYGRTQ